MIFIQIHMKNRVRFQICDRNVNMKAWSEVVGCKKMEEEEEAKIRSITLAPSTREALNATAAHKPTTDWQS